MGNFRIDEWYFKLNLPFLAEKWVKCFSISTVYSTSIRKALKLEENHTYSIRLFIFNNQWRSVGNRAGQNSMDKCMLRSSVLKKNFSRQLFSQMHGEYFRKILIRSVDKYLLFDWRPSSTPSVLAQNIASFVHILFTINQYTCLKIYL